MNLCIFGGSFDPIHRGHLAVARAAARRFNLDQILFVPAPAPPHKPSEALQPFADRYAMVALATAGEPKFVPSDVEFVRSLSSSGRKRPSYSIDTVRHIRRAMKPSDSLFFLLGMDAFLGLSTWRQPEALLRECQIIVATRPGYSQRRWRAALPHSLREKTQFVTAVKPVKAHSSQTGDDIVIRLLDTVHDLNAATTIRKAAAAGRNLARFVTPPVAEYIRKRGLYC